MHNYARSKKESFYWGGFTDLLNEISLMMSFGVLINFSMIQFASPTDWANNLYATVGGLILVFGPILIAIGIYKEFTSHVPPSEMLEGGSPTEVRSILKCRGQRQRANNSVSLDDRQDTRSVSFVLDDDTDLGIEAEIGQE